MSDVNLDRQIEAFFDTFAAASDELDVDRLGELFAETFLAADPAGARPVSREAFLRALPRRAELFAAAGITRVVLADLDRRALDDAYVLVRTVWHAESISASTPIELSSTFILRRDEDGMRVVFYLNHQDLARILSRTTSKTPHPGSRLPPGTPGGPDSRPASNGSREDDEPETGAG
jgi:ketosteroid isomerase-like protein